MNKKRFRIHFSAVLFSLLVIASSAGVAAWYTQRMGVPEIQNVLITSTQPSSTPFATDSPEPTPQIHALVTTPEPSATPQSPILLPVPFLVQAPKANWNALHEDACEEVSLIMAYHYSKKNPLASEEAGDIEIKELVAKGESLGQGPSITIAQLSETAKAYYKIKSTRVVSNASLENIKQELRAGRPVVLPMAGRSLNNPHFKSPGPIYHMLVAIGYDATGFTVNDPGIKEGKNWHYDYSTIEDSWHDWNSSDIQKGGRSYLVFD